MVLLQSKATASENARRVMAKEGIDLNSHRARQFNREALDADLILTMTQSHKDYILNRFPIPRKGICVGEFVGTLAKSVTPSARNRGL